MRRPKERGSVIQFSGKIYVFAGVRRDPGESGLIKPSTTTATTTGKMSVLPFLPLSFPERLTAEARQDAENRSKAQHPQGHERKWNENDSADDFPLGKTPARDQGI